MLIHTFDIIDIISINQQTVQINIRLYYDIHNNFIFMAFFLQICFHRIFNQNKTQTKKEFIFFI
jgi:hypothetical protein